MAITKLCICDRRADWLFEGKTPRDRQHTLNEQQWQWVREHLQAKIKPEPIRRDYESDHQNVQSPALQHGGAEENRRGSGRNHVVSVFVKYLKGGLEVCCAVQRKPTQIVERREAAHLLTAMPLISKCAPRPDGPEPEATRAG